jgi:hypothetical protein
MFIAPYAFHALPSLMNSSALAEAPGGSFDSHAWRSDMPLRRKTALTSSKRRITLRLISRDMGWLKSDYRLGYAIDKAGLFCPEKLEKNALFEENHLLHTSPPGRSLRRRELSTIKQSNCKYCLSAI